jgi:hypothetical protein
VEKSYLTPNLIDVANGSIALEKTKNYDRRVISLKGHALEVIRNLMHQKTQNIKYLSPSKNGLKPIEKSLDGK